MINILLTSIAFPPKNDPESLQVLKYYKYIKKYDVNIDVITSANPTLWMKFDRQIATSTPPPHQLIQIRIFEPRLLSILISKYFKFLLRPDGRFSFFWQWKKAVRLLKQKPDIIYSRSFPLSSTIMAFKLKKYYNVPWILHLSDPWSESPLFNFQGRDLKYHTNLEKKCFNAADIISFTSDETIKLYTKKYPEFKTKYKLFPNVFDNDDAFDSNKSDVLLTGYKKFKIAYTGSLSGSRHLRYIKNALDFINLNYPETSKNIEVVIAGPVDSNMLLMIEEGIPSLTYLGSVSFDEAKKIQYTADVLLVVDFLFQNAEQAVYLPSKIMDYIQANKNILGITNIGSATYNMVHNRYGRCFAHDDAKGLAEQIHTFYEQWKNNLFLPPEIGADENFSAQYNAGQLVELMKTLCKKK